MTHSSPAPCPIKVQNRIAVERAVAEWRSGRPVLIASPTGFLLGATIETLDEATRLTCETLAQGSARLVLTAARLKRLGLPQEKPGAVALPHIDMKRIERLALSLDSAIDAPLLPVTPLELAGLELARISQTLPAILAIALPTSPALDVLSVDADAVFSYRQQQAEMLEIVARAPVPLEQAETSEFVVFRGGEGLRDQVAVIVGTPDFSKSVPVRLHSACLTGDLFGSLKCDCGDQLRGTVGWMAENGGGIVLYLDQEGRGNGISNKMRAYALQAKGFDTYDADEALGFGHDQRRFDFAARMLHLLGVHQVELMTNNPQKIAALGAAGIEVTASRRVIGRPNAHNVGYLATKQHRAGHVIDAQSLMDTLKSDT